MKLFKIDDKGELESLKRLEFKDTDVYIVDDEKTIYIWIGSKISLNKKDIAAKKARNMNKERAHGAKLLLMDQNREYGAFAAMMDTLKAGLKEDDTIDKRPEFKFEETPKEIERLIEKMPSAAIKEDDSLKRLGGWLEQQTKYRKAAAPTVKKNIEESPEEDFRPPESDFDSMVKVSAYLMSQNELSYDELCWFLAERTIVIQKGYNKTSEEEIRAKAEEVFNSRSTYDELCWLIAELDIMVKLGHLVID